MTDDSGVQFKGYVCIWLNRQDKSQLWRLEREQTLDTHTCIYLVCVTGTHISLSHDTPVWDLFTWRLLWEVFSCQSLRLEGWQAFSGLGGPRRSDHPWSSLESVPCFAGYPLTLPCVSVRSCLHTSPFTKCLPSIRSQVHIQSVNSLRPALI